MFVLMDLRRKIETWDCGNGDRCGKVDFTEKSARFCDVAQELPKLPAIGRLNCNVEEATLKLRNAAEITSAIWRLVSRDAQRSAWCNLGNSSAGDAKRSAARRG